jgi:hypothetical protein
MLETLLVEWIASLPCIIPIVSGTKFHLSHEKQIYFQYLELFRECQTLSERRPRVEDSRKSQNRNRKGSHLFYQKDYALDNPPNKKRSVFYEYSLSQYVQTSMILVYEFGFRVLHKARDYIKTILHKVYKQISDYGHSETPSITCACLLNCLQFLYCQP